MLLPGNAAFSLEVGEVIVHVPGCCFHMRRGMLMPLFIHSLVINFKLLLDKNCGSLILLPIKKVAIVLILPLKVFGQFGIVTIVFGQNFRNIIYLVGVVLLVERLYSFFRRGAKTKSKANVSLLFPPVRSLPLLIA